jgi:hypothetical protein
MAPPPPLDAQEITIKEVDFLGSKIRCYFHAEHQRRLESCHSHTTLAPHSHINQTIEGLIPFIPLCRRVGYCGLDKEGYSILLCRPVDISYLDTLAFSSAQSVPPLEKVVLPSGTKVYFPTIILPIYHSS